MSGALSGLRVIEMAAIGPVPFAAMMLADMGAKITRIDRITRTPGSSGFENRGRASIAVDLKNPDAAHTVLRLVEQADVLLEGFRPGVMEKLGLGPQVCLKRNPALVFGRMTGWGQSGPLAKAAGHDLNYIALTGALHAMGHSGQPPQPPLNLLGDYGGGAMMLLVGVLAALYERQRSGHGQIVDAAMTDGVATLMSPIYSLLAQGAWRDERASNLLDGAAHFYGTYECADGRFITIGSIEPQFYALLLQKCAVDDPEFRNQLDPAGWPKLKSRFAALFKSRTRAEWCALLEGTDVCFAPVLSMTEAPQHPHNRARETFFVNNGVVQPSPAPRLSRTPSSASRHVAVEGEHSVQLLSDAGFTQREINHLIAQGAVLASGPDARSPLAHENLTAT